MDGLERIDPLLEVDVVGRELGLLFSEALATSHSVSKSGTSQVSRTLSSAWPNCSLVY